MDGASPADAAQWAAALDWWREAGVDCTFADTPREWLRLPAEAAAGGDARSSTTVAPEATAPPSGRDRSTWPTELADFHTWWLTEPWLDSGSAERRVLPRGSARPALMVVVAEPEADDGDNLLSGPQGRLLEAFLKAAGVDLSATYVSSVIPRCLPHADWAAIAAAGLGEVLAHHIAIVQPTRLMVLGAGVPPLIGHDPAQSDQSSRRFNHGDSSVPLFCGRDLATLLAKPAWKAGFWRRWLEWSALADAEQVTG